MPTTSSAPGARALRNPPPSPPAEAEVRAETIASEAALARLRPEWETLWSADPRATPFQHPAWLLPWWRHVGRGRLASVALRSRSGELVGFAPLYLYQASDDAPVQLFPLGIATTDVLDLLVRPGWQGAVRPALEAQLADAAAAAQEWMLPQLRADSPLLQLPCPAGWEQSIEADESHPVLDLRDPAAIPRGMVADARYLRRRAEREGALGFGSADAERLEEVLEALVRLHGERWSERGEAGVLQDAAVLAAHREAAPQLLAAGLLRLHALRFAGEIVAVLYCLADAPQRRERRWYDYIGGFDPRCKAFSPGTLLLAQAIEAARGEGAVGFDFLRGSERYKYRWGAVDEAMLRLRRWRA